MKTFDDNGIEEDIVDWFVSNYDIDSDCIKVTSVEEDDDEGSVDIVVSYDSEDWATELPDEENSDDEALFASMETSIEDSMYEIASDNGLEYDSVQISHDSKFTWNATFTFYMNSSNAYDSDENADYEEEFEN